jgi:hypothetical protein
MTSWWERALCAKFPPDLWQPADRAEAREAAAICLECPVRIACFSYAQENDERHGVWGGVWLDAPGRPMVDPRTREERRAVTDKARRAQRRAQRVDVGGRLIAPVPPAMHGQHCANQWGCQCDVARAMKAERSRQYRRRKAQRRGAA